MFFYVDESGHTGPNLFDENQPTLYYGVVSSKLNIDVLAEGVLSKLRKHLGVERLHANEIGNEGIAEIAEDIAILQKKYDLRFDLYRIQKADHALISFFDQVFDQGLNPAVTWTAYWTPLRYVLLLKLASLFDVDLLERAWDARIEPKSEVAEMELVKICQELKSRVGSLSDERSRTLIFDALDWVENHPSEIHYNVKRKKDVLAITPNLIGFQFVMSGIARRIIKQGRKASQITVDQQSQFNKSQNTLAKFYASQNHQPSFEVGPGLPEVSFKGMPDIPITFSSSANSAGLELVDIYLWLFKRVLDGKEVAPEAAPLFNKQMHQGRTDEVSLNAIAKRWLQWFEDLPEPTVEQVEAAKELVKIDEQRRITGMGRRENDV